MHERYIISEELGHYMRATMSLLLLIALIQYSLLLYYYNFLLVYSPFSILSMPLIDNDAIANYTSMNKSKQKSWDVFLYPSKKNVTDSFIETSDNLHDQEKCLFSVQLGVLLIAVLFYIFIHYLLRVK
jgi:hypothetical protein